MTTTANESIEPNPCGAGPLDDYKVLGRPLTSSLLLQMRSLIPNLNQSLV